MNQEPTHPYNPHTGTPAPPRHLSRALDIGAPLPAGIVFPSHCYTRVSSTSDAMHLQGDFMACVNYGNPDFTTYNAQAAQYLPGFNPPFYEYYQLHHAASHMIENGLLTWSPTPHGYFQVADKVMQAPPSRVVSSEKPVHVSELSPSTSYSILSSSSASTMTANPQTIIKDKNGSTYSEREESVVSVTEHMPEDVINAVTIVDAKGNEFVVVKVEDIHFDLSQVKDISYRRSAVNL
nr:PREDICTED: uncharacterized protein LOC109628735 [Paralichthys olivaceus]